MKTKITHSDIIEKQKDLAEKHQGIKTNYRWNLNEFDGPVRPGTIFPLMTIESPTVEVGNTESLPFLNYQCAFNILGMDGVYTSDRNDEISQNKVINNALEIALELFRKLIQDNSIAFNTDGTNNKWYSLLDKLSFQFTKIGPVTSDYLYGYRCEFVLKSPFCSELTPEKWQ